MRNLVLLGCIVWLTFLAYGLKKDVDFWKSASQTTQSLLDAQQGANAICIKELNLQNGINGACKDELDDCNMGLQICSELVNK